MEEIKKEYEPQRFWKFSGIEKALMDKTKMMGGTKLEASFDSMMKIRHAVVWASGASSHRYLRDALILLSMDCWAEERMSESHYLYGSESYDDNLDRALMEGYLLVGEYTEDELFRLELRFEERKTDEEKGNQKLAIRQGFFVEAERFELAYDRLNELYTSLSDS